MGRRVVSVRDYWWLAVGWEWGDGSAACSSRRRRRRRRRPSCTAGTFKLRRPARRTPFRPRLGSMARLSSVPGNGRKQINITTLTGVTPLLVDRPQTSGRARTYITLLFPRCKTKWTGNADLGCLLACTCVYGVAIGAAWRSPIAAKVFGAVCLACGGEFQCLSHETLWRIIFMPRLK